mgnify:FL=1
MISPAIQQLKTRVRVILPVTPKHKRGACSEVTCALRCDLLIIPEDADGNPQKHLAFGLCSDHWHGAQHNGQVIVEMNMPTLQPTEEKSA